jgi:hypothetical protein
MGSDTRDKLNTAPKRVWRISRNAPMGEWVVVQPAPAVQNPTPVAPQRRDDLPEVSSGNWVTSSYDLLSGSDVTEDPDTLPGDLFDELFAPRKDDTKSPER